MKLCLAVRLASVKQMMTKKVFSRKHLDCLLEKPLPRTSVCGTADVTLKLEIQVNDYDPST
jgi:hypothetical protein